MNKVDKKYKDGIYEEIKVDNKINDKKLGALLVLIVLISLICGFLGSLFVIKYTNNKSTTNNINTKAITVKETASIADAVEKVYDAVVVIEVYKDKKLSSTGTGFVYKKNDANAYIMTNNHVVDNGDTIKVLFNNNEEMTATIVGKDTYSDIAVLSVKAPKDIKVATTGKTKDIKVGDTVFTVGSPEGASYAGTVTKGILSGKDRLVEVALSSSKTSDYYMSVLQTDAAINPGNSGGPICNIKGEVIGITNMKLVDDSVEGMGFAIPIEDAEEVASILETEGKISRPYIGISMLDMSDGYYLWQAGINIPENVTTGVAVYSVEKDSPASSASLQKGDIIIEVAGKKVKSVAEFRYQLYKHKPGETIEIKYNRAGKEAKTNITLSKNNN